MLIIRGLSATLVVVAEFPRCECQFFAGGRVPERDAQGMQVQSACRGARRPALWRSSLQYADLRGGPATVKEVAEDRASQAEGVGAVDAELVGAACMRVKQQVCRAVGIHLNDFVVCMGCFALLEVNFLSWAFVVVRAQRQGDVSGKAVFRKQSLPRLRRGPLPLRPGG